MTLLQQNMSYYKIWKGNIATKKTTFCNKESALQQIRETDAKLVEGGGWPAAWSSERSDLMGKRPAWCLSAGPLRPISLLVVPLAVCTPHSSTSCLSPRSLRPTCHHDTLSCLLAKPGGGGEWRNLERERKRKGGRMGGECFLDWRCGQWEREAWGRD